MDEYVFILLLIAVVVIAATAAVVQHLREQERTKQMEAAAHELGFSFSPEAVPGLQPALSHFRLFQQGRSKKIRNVLRTHIAGVEVTIFDYRYRTGSGKHSKTWDQTVLVLDSERVRLPAFSLRPEHVFHKLGGLLGYQDIDFDASPRFSEAYLLQGRVEDEIRALFGDQVLSYYTRHADLCTEGNGRQLLHYRSRRRVPPHELGDFLQEGLDVLAVFLEQEDPLAGLDLLDIDLTADSLHLPAP